MNKMEGLRAGVAEMRSVAQRLLEWAHELEQTVSDDLQVVSSNETSELPGGESRRLRLRTGDLESTFRGEKADEPEVPASKPGPASRKKRAADSACAEPAAAKEERKALTLPEVRAILAEKVAEGFGAQVKALIESCGAASLKGVPAEKYGELLEAVGQLEGEPLSTASGGNLERGEVNRNKRAPQCGVAPIEVAEVQDAG